LEVSFLKNILSSLASSIERHQAQAHLKTLFDDRNRIIESIDDGFFVIDRDYTVSMWNKEAARILSYQHDEIIGKKLTQFIDKEVFYNFYRWFDDAFAKKVTTHFEEQSATTGRWYDVSVYPEGERLSVFFRDISSQKKLEQALRSSNERFEKVTQATQDAIWDWDLPSKSILWGTGYYTMFGYGVDGPQAFDLWKERIHPDDIQRVTNSLEQALYGLGDPGAEKWQCEFRFRRADGSYAHVIDMGLVLRNEAGDATRMVGAMNDISHRKEYEASLQALNEQLEMNVEELAKSNHELEQFAYIASHDLQEPLRMVSSFLEQLRKKYDNELDDRAQTYIHYAVDGAARMRQIILDLLDFSRVGKFTDPPTPVSLAQVVGEATLLLGEQVKESQARIRHEGLPVVQGHKSALVQIMQNLLGNAIKYARKETPPQIEVRAAEEKDQWAISVSDNGIGIDPAYTEKVFLLFQKLHRREEYPGTGMGLAIVKKNVELMGGKVWVESNLGQGATFIFTLPKNIKKSIHKKGKHETSA
jgi:PAS domain S-box-containing protein